MLIAKHTGILLPLLYYSTTLAAVIYPFDSSWGWSLLKGMPVYGLLVFGWLYFYRFKVLNLSYKTMAVFSTLLFFLIYNPVHLKQFLYFGPITHGGDYSNTMSLQQWAYNIALTLNSHALVWSPYIFFTYFLWRGLKNMCPKCKLVDALFAKIILHSEHRGTSKSGGLETTQKKVTVMYGHDAGRQRTEYETRYVTNTTDTYEIFCSCKICDHKWSYYRSYTVKT